MRSDDLAGVEPVVWIEGVFDLSKDVVDFGSVLFFDERGSDEPFAVFAADCAAERPDQQRQPDNERSIPPQDADTVAGCTPPCLRPAHQKYCRDTCAE